MSDETTPAVPSDDGDRSLLELVDRLTDLLNRSDLTELEVTAGETKLVLRKPSALAPVVPLALAGLGAAAVAVGQVIGLIEAMKLFNEIKSDLAGRVVKICAESGKLVKTKGPLIEVEPL